MRKIEATLLITIFIASMLTMITPVVVAKGNIIKIPEDFPTIQEAVNAAVDGYKIEVGKGEWYGAIVNKAVEIMGKKGAIIVDGPPYSPSGHPLHYGFLIALGGGRSTISGFTFRGGPIGATGTFLAFPIFSRDGVNEVTIENNEIYNALQGITNWHGDNWVIQHNTLNGLWTYNGGGLGILIGSRLASDPAVGNLIAHNTVQASFLGTELDGTPRTYTCSGIIITADARFSEPGEVSNNKVVNNKVMVTGPDTYAISLEAIGDITPDHAKSLVHDNIVNSNKLQGSDNPIGLVPPELEEVNTISAKQGKK